MAPQDVTLEHGPCPDAGVLVELARGTLPKDAHPGVAEHVRACDECGQVLAAFTHVPSPPPTTGESTTVPTAHVEPGDVLAGKYRVERVIGLGGMGVVVAAKHLQLGHDVALKFMLPRAHASQEATARFFREARAAAAMKGEHVARAVDMGTLENGAPFMVMDLLRGTDLAKLLVAKKTLPVDLALDYVLQACEALAEAHDLGIVHRDLKPANLFLTSRPDGSPLIKVLDFGISKYAGESGDPSLTESQVVLGSPRYMSPEQMRSAKSVGPHTDVWALGCILYELLSGSPAFDADTTHGLSVVIASEPSPRIRAVCPEIAIDLEEIILACLEKDPSHRIRSVVELARRLGPLAPKESDVSVQRILRHEQRSQALPELARTVPSVPAPPPEGTNHGLARSNREEAGRRRGTLLAVLVAGAVGVLGLYWYFGASAPLAAPPQVGSSLGSSPPSSVPAPLPLAPRADVPAVLASTAPAALDPASPSPAPPTPAAIARRAGPEVKAAAATSASSTPIDLNRKGLLDRK